MPYWLCKDKVLFHEGKDYKYGDKLPDSLPEVSLQKMIANGKASVDVPSIEKAASMDAEVDGVRDEVVRLRTKIVELTKENERLVVENADLQAATTDAESNAQLVIDLQADLADADKTIAELTAQITAGPKGGKK